MAKPPEDVVDYQVSTRLNKAHWEALMEDSEENDRSLSATVRRAVRFYVEEHLDG